MSILIQSGSIEKTTKTNFNTRSQDLRVTQTKTAIVINFGFQEGVAIQSVFGTDFQSNGGFVFAVPGGFGTGFDVRVDAVVVRGGVGVEAVGTVGI